MDEKIKKEAMEYQLLLRTAYSDTDCTIHGPAHVARVLCLSLTIADKEGIMDQHIRQMLAIAAILHDCGRKTDASEPDHGRKSAELTERLCEKNPQILDMEFSEKEIEIIYTLIKYHSLPDELGIYEIENFLPEQKELAMYLFQILKDADGLDRVRLKGTTGETDLSYLRLASSKTLLPLSEQMYKEHWETFLL